MSGISVTCTGAAQAGRKLRDVAQRAQRQQHTFEREGRAAQRAIAGIPVKTGRLEKGVTGGPGSILNVRDDGYTIATSVPYARFVFGGTKRMTARPPRIPRDLGSSAADAVGLDLRRA